MSGTDLRAAPDAELRISRITEADRAAWRAWATERAQDSFRRGREATELGQFAEARRWLERAHRLARDSSTVLFPLAVARLQTGDPIGAMTLLKALLRRFDQRECWVMLAAARTAAHQADQAADALGEALRRHAPDRSMSNFLSETAKSAGWPGWCGLSGDGTLHAVQAGAGGGTLDIRIDGVPVKGRLRNGRIALRAGWNRARSVTVQRNGAALLGSPIDIASVIRTEGFVEAVDGALTGWIWHPGEPERRPEVTLRDGAGRTVHAVMEELAEIPSADAPLARPRLLRFDPAQLAGLDMASGPVTVEGSDGRPLVGSPLDPGLERRAASALAAIQAEASRVAAFGRAGLPAPVPPSAPPPSFLPVAAALVGENPAVGPVRETDVVVPVFKHLRRTLDCLESVLAAMPEGGRLVVVEDRSPDGALVSALVSMAAQDRIVLIRRAENGGFPASANDGIAACAGRDVVLLNADTLVAPGWLEALKRGVYSAPDIGTATPFSNEATILSYPDHRDRNPCPDLAGTRRMMALAAVANGDSVVDIPTGHGFCLYLRRDCLDQAGLLREDLFAQGYGEENDFCLRARHLGWRHVAVPGAFVAHEGNVSFGAARTGLMRRNGEILNRLHPGYDALIAQHIADDPLAPARFRLDAARWAALRRRDERGQPPRAVLLITHAQGGGVDRVVRERARRAQAQGLRPIALRPDGDGVVLSDLSVDERFPNLRFALPAEFEALVAFLRPDGVVHAEWHHLLGHHASLRGLCARLGVPFDAFVHDYAWFCQRIALVGPQGRYCGEPDPAGCERCIATQGSNLAERITVPALLKRSARELAEARRVIAPSDDAARRIARHFPGIRAEISPWEADRPDLSLARLAAVSSPAPRAPGRRGGGPDRPARIVVIGAIGREKGYEVLRDCLIDARARALPLEFVVVGHTPDDMALMDQGCLFVTGEYREEDGVGLVAEQEADFAFLPSIWPETWCFTLSVAWRAGLPVAAFDIGAQADRIRATGRGAVLPLGLPIADLNTVLLRLCRPGAGTTRQARPHSAAVAEHGARPIAKRTPSSHHPQP
ncbi:glycosyltransferase [Acetobacteraceae bacterium KSS8]|uniref:Glycosyltransferase n=1 Tax=Endosaccharibacter trunci TaxID=2812733 RepID=A0ABT1W5N1_9PROT|nr:glycosyltransferase [Acetobacteraceae bacterium KSS8]